MANHMRVGVVGGGNIARRLHLPTWLTTPGVTVVAVADPSPPALAAAREIAGLGGADAHADAMLLIERADVDIVDICTPPAFRGPLVVAAARAGKHVLAEKPLATRPVDGRAAVDAADQAGVVLGTCHNYLVLDEVRAVRDVIASGEIGDVRTASVNYLGVRYVPGSTGDWRRDPTSSGGGVLMDMMHAVYLLEAFLDERIERVSAWVDSRDPTAHVEDLALCRFESATKAGLVNIGWGFGNGHIDVTGTLGRVSVQYQDGGTAPWSPLEKVTATTARGTWTVLGPEAPRPETYDEFPPIANTFHRLVDAFLAAVREGGTPMASGADGLRALEGAVGAYASAASGQVVTLPLDRSSSPYLHGAVGVPSLARSGWSPLERLPLFAPVSAGRPWS